MIYIDWLNLIIICVVMTYKMRELYILYTWFSSCILYIRGISNRFLRKSGYMLHEESIDVEWLYAFDVHTNAFFPLILFIHGIQLIFFNWMVGNGWVDRIICNLIYLIGFAYYSYVTFLGFSVLPFLQDTIIFFVYPLCLLLFGYVISIFTVNVASLMYMYYFR